ncbi:MerR family transcriptional regulator [Oenococcus alcoholitolerans]|uniref:MerR family transcriptional regulator n=1 Tax=Oenococcus alcoholitolerans TaxID=931074 RepID=UPI003F7251F4
MSEETNQLNQVINLRNMVRSIIKKNGIKIGITDLADATGVSATQLRYWLEKGYIRSDSDDKQKKFPYETVFRVAIIKKFQDEGFTLAAAVKKTDRHSTIIKAFKQMLYDRLVDIKDYENGSVLIDLGIFDPEPSKHLIAHLDDEKTTFELK